MKHVVSLSLILLLAGCASPKYTYRFAPSPYLASIQNDRQANPPVAAAEQHGSSEEGQILVASAETPASVIAPVEAPKAKKINKAIVKLKEKATTLGGKVSASARRMATPEPASIDDDLKLAVILGAAGIVALLLLVISKIFGIIGGIALIAAVIYFAKWVINQ